MSVLDAQPDARHTDPAPPCPPVPPRFADALDGLDHVDYMVIHPDGRLAAVRATVLPGDESLLPVLQAGVSGLIERVSLRGDLDAWVNEEGFLLGLPFNPVAAAVCKRARRRRHGSGPVRPRVGPRHRRRVRGEPHRRPAAAGRRGLAGGHQPQRRGASPAPA